MNLRPTTPWVAAVSCAVLLAACSSKAPAPGTRDTSGPLSAPGPVAGAPAPPAASPRPTLLDEQRRLAALFRGTPVVFAMQAETRMQVDVPLRHSFDAGQAIVKPPLGAVLDRIALSQAGGTSRIAIAAPADRAASAPPRPAGAARADGGKPGTAGAGRAAGAQPGTGSAGSAAAAPPSAATLRQERLADERRGRMTDYLAGKGIGASRLSAAPAMPAGTGVRLVVDDGPLP